jgi:hypothetical protein
MLKWFILAAFLAGVTMGTFSSGSGPAKSRFGCPGSSGGGDNDNSSENTNENGADANTNLNGADNANSNSAANDNGADNSNANENTNGAANTNTNGSANTNDNSSNSNVNDNGDGTGATINGRFAGTLTGESVQSLDGSPNAPRAVQLVPSIQFEGAFTPVILPVLHYADTTSGGGGAPATVDRENLTNVLVGQTQTFNYTDTGPVTLGVTVTEASYLTREFRVVLALTFDSTSGNLTRTGTGTQIIEGELDGNGDLVVTIDVQYEIDLVAGSFSFETAETIDLTGTLPRQQ